MKGRKTDGRASRNQRRGHVQRQHAARIPSPTEEGLHLVHRRLPRSSSSCWRSSSRWDLPRNWIGYIFLLATVGLYAGIGIMSRTSDAAEYYVAGRRVPALFNGMATGADWMSAASFIGMAGTLYLTGYGGLAFIMGWTGGYCLVALFLAPYLRKFGQFTIPDFLGARYGGNIPRFVGIIAAILCSFTYVVAQIYGVGLITTRLIGVPFEIGIFLGLGGILVCSFLGGMRAVTWTQVAQYIILIVAYMIPVVWLSVKHTGVPVPQLVYGKVLEKVDRPRREPDQGSEGARGPRHLQGARRRGERQAEGPAGESYDDGKKALTAAIDKAEGRQRRAGSRSPPPRRRWPRIPKDAAAAKAAWTQGRRARRARGSADAPRRGVPGQGRGRARRLAPQLPRAGVLPDGRHRRAAAHPDALLHDAVGAGGARVGVLVAVLHLPAVLHGARAGGARQVRRLHVPGRLRVRQAAAVGGVVGEGRSIAAVDRRRQQGRHRAARGNRDRRRHRRAGHAGDRRPAVRDLRPRGRGRSGRGAVDRRRPAADDRQRAVARPLLQDARSARVDRAPGDDLQDPAAGGGA